MNKQTKGLYALIIIMGLLCFISGLAVGSRSMIEKSIEICLDTCECPEENIQYGFGNNLYKINTSQFFNKNYDVVEDE